MWTNIQRKRETHCWFVRFVEFSSRSVPTGSVRDQGRRQAEAASLLTSSPAAGVAQQRHGNLGELRLRKTSSVIRTSKMTHVCLNLLQCDPTLLPEPNHVMLNHLYALSIKVPPTLVLLLWNHSDVILESVRQKWIIIEVSSAGFFQCRWIF